MTTITYRCADCSQPFELETTGREDVTGLDPGRGEVCGKCGRKVGEGSVTCAGCGESFVLPMPHWHLSCDLAGGPCPACGKPFQGVCVC